MTTYEPPGGLPWGLFALTGGSLLLNIVLVTRWTMAPGITAQSCEPVQVSRAAAAVAPEPAAAVPAEPVAVAEVVEPVVEEPVEDPLPEGMKTARLTVHHSLARTFQDGVSSGGDELSAKVARLFVWDLNLRRDLQKGDKINVAWIGGADEVEIEAARYVSNKRGTFEAFRFQAEGDAYPSWWSADGTEMARQLENSPLQGYEQITSLLKDRPRHRGMDFKTDVGTPVTSPKSGTVLRANWNTKNNGNCVEVRFNDGTVAKFLHLSRTDAKSGQRVSAGTVIGLSGNTGHSTAPHLHYELAKNEKVVDPVDYHGVTQRKLTAGDQAKLDTVVARLSRAVR